MNQISPSNGELAGSVGSTTEVSWTAPRHMTYDQWHSFGRTFQQIHKSIQWWVGDWLNAGERRFGDIALQAVEETGRGVESLLKCKAVAARYAPEQRKPELSFTHHLTAAYMDEEFRDDVLNLAIRYDLSTRDLKAIIAMPVKLLHELIDAYRNHMPIKQFYQLYEAKRVEASEWDKMVVNDDRHPSKQPPETVAEQEIEFVLGERRATGDDEWEDEPLAHAGKNDDGPFVDEGDAGNYDWTAQFEQDLEGVFRFFERHGAPLKVIYLSEAVWEGMAVRAAVDSDGGPILIWEPLP